MKNSSPPSTTTEPGLAASAQAELLTPRAAATRLQISVTTLYDWLGQSDWGLFAIRGEKVNIDYFQGGPRGRGRIRIPAAEVERILGLMRVPPKRPPPAPKAPPQSFPGITVPLGRLPS